MPFEIIRNDITRIKADAIVNTANPHVAIGAGVDTAIYEAAGRERLFEARKKIGEIPFGEVRATPAYKLSAKYIFHASGPVWVDGEHNEREILRKCYENCLELALQKRCKSIAFPFIATGSYGFPRDEALRIAISVFGQYLVEYDIQIYLVVFDKKSYGVSTRLFLDVEAFIDEHYVADSLASEYRGSLPQVLVAEGVEPSEHMSKLCTSESAESFLDRREAWTTESSEPVAAKPETGALENNKFTTLGETEDRAYILEFSKREQPKSHSPLSAKCSEPYPTECSASSSTTRLQQDRPLVEPSIPMMQNAIPMQNLDAYLQQLQKPMTEHLQQLINKKGMINAEVYKRANMDKKYFSKLINGKVKPTKLKLLSLAIALELNLDETKDLLLCAGYALSPSSKSDLIFEYYIRKGEYDIFTIDITLFDYGLPTVVND